MAAFEFAMGFHKLVRCEVDGTARYGDLLESSEKGFRVALLNGSLADGLIDAGAEPVIVKKVTREYLSSFSFPSFHVRK